jgi:hypothetical protein
MPDINAHKGTVVTIVGGISSGAAQLLNVIPNDIGKVSVLLGVVLTVYYIQVQRLTREEKKLDLKIKQIALENAERESANRRRKEDIDTEGFH